MSGAIVTLVQNISFFFLLQLQPHLQLTLLNNSTLIQNNRPLNVEHSRPFVIQNYLLFSRNFMLAT